MTDLTLGVIADDFTGATDIGSMLARGGMRVVQTNGAPSAATMAGIDADAVIVALKSRSIPATDAVRQSLDSCRVLQEHGALQIYFKYCSTFDSTPDGNIGPVNIWARKSRPTFRRCRKTAARCFTGTCSCSASC